MRNREKIATLMLAAILMLSSFALYSCGEDNGVVPNIFKGKWELCGLAPKDEEMSVDNIIAGKELADTYGLEMDDSQKNQIEFDKGGGLKPYTDGSIHGTGVETMTRISDREVCYGLEITEMDGKELYDDPIKMDVHARIVDDYLFLWEEYTNTDEYEESDTYQIYQKVK